MVITASSYCLLFYMHYIMDIKYHAYLHSFAYYKYVG